MKNSFQSIFKGKVMIVGMGNSLRQDDGLGPVLIKRLSKKVKAVCLDGGTAPENYLGKIVQENPDTILIVDALDLGKAPGTYEILQKDDLLKIGLSTHDISPKILINYLENQTKANIYILGVQPKSIAFGEQMSAELKKALEEISARIIKQDRFSSCSKEVPQS